MTPLLVTATLDGPISLTTGALHLDALLAWSVAIRMNLPPVGFSEPVPIEIPVEREPGGRFHLCSSSLVAFEAREMRYVNRKFPLAEAQLMAGPALKRIHIGAGAQKSYRIPSYLSFAKGDLLSWFCVGDDEAITDLLASISHLGKRRAVGRGRVREWRVSKTEPWGDGFPIVQDGVPLRPLPRDWPGLRDPMLARAALTYPYWDASKQVVCAVPEATT